MGVKEDTDAKMKGALEHLAHELKSIRTGRANPALLDSVMVEVYGTQMRLKDLATVTTPEPRQLLITPFDQSNTNTIGKAIEKANLGFLTVVEGNLIRIKIPSMDESLRKEMAKQCHKKREDCKVSIRNVRREANDHVRKDKGDGEISEDEMKRLEKEVQELTDRYCKDADEMAKKKEEEVLTVS